MHVRGVFPAIPASCSMPNSKARCGGCKNYFPREKMTKAGLVNICGDDCRTTMVRKQHYVRERQAKNRAQKGGHLGSRLRRHIRQRDSNVCRYCMKSAYRLEVHHITYRSQGGPDHSGNLILLCDDHHRLVHSNKRRWQPLLRAVIWAHYVEGRYYTVPQMERRVKAEALVADFTDGLPEADE